MNRILSHGFLTAGKISFLIKKISNPHLFCCSRIYSDNLIYHSFENLTVHLLFTRKRNLGRAYCHGTSRQPNSPHLRENSIDGASLVSHGRSGNLHIISIIYGNHSFAFAALNLLLFFLILCINYYRGPEMGSYYHKLFIRDIFSSADEIF